MILFDFSFSLTFRYFTFRSVKYWFYVFYVYQTPNQNDYRFISYTHSYTHSNVLFVANNRNSNNTNNETIIIVRLFWISHVHSESVRQNGLAKNREKKIFWKDRQFFLLCLKKSLRYFHKQCDFTVWEIKSYAKRNKNVNAKRIQNRFGSLWISTKLTKYTKTAANQARRTVKQLNATNYALIFVFARFSELCAVWETEQALCIIFLCVICFDFLQFDFNWFKMQYFSVFYRLILFFNQKMIVSTLIKRFAA